MSYILLQMDVTRWLVGSNREKCNTFKVYKFFVFFFLSISLEILTTVLLESLFSLLINKKA